MSTNWMPGFFKAHGHAVARSEIKTVKIRDIEKWLHGGLPDSDPRDFVAARALGLPWPKGMPLPVLSGDLLIDGNHRITAAEEAGYKEIPAVVADEGLVDALYEFYRNKYGGGDLMAVMEEHHEYGGDFLGDLIGLIYTEASPKIRASMEP